MKKIIHWFAITKILFLPIKDALFLAGIVAKTKKEAALKESKLTSLISSIAKDQRKALSNLEYRLLSALAEKTEKIDGEIAEVGVYRGGSAKIICETTEKEVHLFDTFSGLPEIGKEDDREQFKKGEYNASYDEVRNYLKEYPNIHYYKGLFPDTAKPVKNKKFSLVHLDVDIYESTLKGLEFFYPRMSTGAVIISHDYTSATGVKKAFDEFFKGKPEVVILPFRQSTQCLVIKK